MHVVPTAGRDGRDLCSPVNTGSLGSCIACRNVKGSGGHSAGGPMPQSPARVDAAAVWVSMDQSYPSLHPPLSPGLSPVLNWEEEHLLDKRGCWLQTHIHAPVSHHRPSHCQRRWGHNSGPNRQPEPCPLTPGPQAASCWLSNPRRRSRGRDHVCVPSGLPERAPGSPAGPLRTQRPWAPCG